VENTIFLKKKLEKMGQNSQLHRLNVQAFIRGSGGKKTMQSSFSYGSTVLENGHTFKYYAGAEIAFPENSTDYEVDLETKVVYPKIRNGWNTTALLDEDLKMEIDGKLSFGQNGQLKNVLFKSTLVLFSVSPLKYETLGIFSLPLLLAGQNSIF